MNKKQVKESARGLYTDIKEVMESKKFAVYDGKDNKFQSELMKMYRDLGNTLTQIETVAEF